MKNCDLKKILFITAFPPGNESAGQHYTYRLLNQLADSYKVDLIYFKHSGAKQDYTPHKNNIRVMKKISLSFFRRLTGVLSLPIYHPLFTNRFSWKTLFFIRKKAAAYDLCYFDFSQVFIYAPFVKSSKKILMAHDVVTQMYERRAKNFISQIEARFCRYTEQKILKKSRAEIFCFSEKDKNLLQQYFDLTASRTDFFLDERISKSGGILKYDFCFYGAWGRPENSEGLIWFLEKVLPKLENRPSIAIIGNGYDKALETRMLEYENLNLLGFLKDPYEALSASGALIAPVFEGAGVKVKVVEALACGVPVIGTKTAFEGIDFAPPEYLISCNDSDSFVEAIQQYRVLSPDKKEALQNDIQSNYPKYSFLNYLEAEK